MPLAVLMNLGFAGSGVAAVVAPGVSRGEDGFGQRWRTGWARWAFVGLLWNLLWPQ